MASPFGMKTAQPVYIEQSVSDLDVVYINGGKRGFIVKMAAADLQILQQQAVEVAV